MRGCTVQSIRSDRALSTRIRSISSSICFGRSQWGVVTKEGVLDGLALQTVPVILAKR